MKVVIIEDETAALEQLKMLLEQNSEFDIEVVENIESVVESIEFFKSPRCQDIDLVFMDIHLADGYAFSIFKHVEVVIPIIFTTAYDEYALKAFEVNCLDYILKPISNNDIERIFAKIKLIAQHSRKMIAPKSVETLLAIDGWRTTPLNICDVAFFYKSESKVQAHSYSGKVYLINLTLEKLEEQLDPELFTRANRQYIIARQAVQNIESWEGSRALINLTATTPERLIISRTKVAQFKRWLSQK